MVGVGDGIGVPRGGVNVAGAFGALTVATVGIGAMVVPDWAVEVFSVERQASRLRLLAQ